MTGTTWVEESGFLEGPVMITNTHCVGAVHQGTIAWRVKQGGPDATGYFWSNPVVAETWDGELNDINGFHVKEANVFEALDATQSGPGGRGQRRRRHRDDLQRLQGRHRHGLARAARTSAGGYTVGVLVQCNYGRKHEPARSQACRSGARSPAPARGTRTRARSSSSSRPTRRSCRTS